MEFGQILLQLVINISNLFLALLWGLETSFRAFHSFDIIAILGTLSGLRQFLATESPLKIMKNAFYFTIKALLILKIFNFFFDFLVM